MQNYIILKYKLLNLSEIETSFSIDASMLYEFQIDSSDFLSCEDKQVYV